MTNFKEKAFTLIELLAVIIILAVIALILTPTIMNIIENSREKSAEESVNSYVSAANNASALSLFDSTKGITITSDKYLFVTGTDNDELAKIDVSGVSPTYVYLEYDTNAKSVSIGHFCIKGYNIDYNNGTTSKSVNDYCGNNSSSSTNSSNIVTSLPIGNIIQLQLESTYNDVTWNSSESSIATVDENGFVTGIKKGNVIINAVSNGNNYSYNIKVIYSLLYKDGEVIYFNVSTGKVCDALEAVSTTNTKSGCMKFYAFGDSSSSSTVNMILDHNTTATNVLWAASVNTAGPTTAYTQLKSDTSSWVGVETQSNYQYTNSSTSYTVKYGDDNANARFITANEVAKITGNTSFNSSTSTDDAHFYFDSNSITQTAKSQGASKYAWLYNYTYGCAANGCNTEDNTSYNPNNIYGYWTSDAVAGGSSNAWRVTWNGSIGGTDVTSTIRRGVRPVITVLKSNL